MGKITQIENPQERLSPRLVRVLEKVRDHWLPRDYDCIIIVEAPERGGKSTLGNLMCSVVDPTFTIEERNLYTQEDFQKFLNTTEKRRAVCLDEGASMFFRRNAMKTENKKGLIALTTMGAKNLFVVIPTVDATMIESYLLRKRARFFIRVTKRGRFKFFSPQASKQIYYDKRTMRMHYPPPTFTGGYGKLTDLEWKAYEGQKFTALKTDEPEAEERKLYRRKDAAKYLAIHPKTLDVWRRNGRIMAVQVKTEWKFPLTELDKCVTTPNSTE